MKKIGRRAGSKAVAPGPHIHVVWGAALRRRTLCRIKPDRVADFHRLHAMIWDRGGEEGEVHRG